MAKAKGYDHVAYTHSTCTVSNGEYLFVKKLFFITVENIHLLQIQPLFLFFSRSMNAGLLVRAVVRFPAIDSASLILSLQKKKNTRR